MHSHKHHSYEYIVEYVLLLCNSMSCSATACLYAKTTGDHLAQLTSHIDVCATTKNEYTYYYIPFEAGVCFACWEIKTQPVVIIR